MENASQALLIAGGMLLAILIIATGIILYNSFSNTTNQYSQSMTRKELVEFNAKFEVFRGRTDVTAQEIATLYNLTEEYEKNTYYSVDVKVNSISIVNPIDFIKQYSNDESEPTERIYFKCERIEYDGGEVKLIEFKRNI